MTNIIQESSPRPLNNDVCALPLCCNRCLVTGFFVHVAHWGLKLNISAVFPHLMPAFSSLEVQQFLWLHHKKRFPPSHWTNLGPLLTLPSCQLFLQSSIFLFSRSRPIHSKLLSSKFLHFFWRSLSLLKPLRLAVGPQAKASHDHGWLI